MKELQIIALEVSTASAKCALYSPQDGITKTVERRLPPEVTDWVTQDADGMVQVALDTLKELVSQIDVSIDAIGLGGTWHSLLLLDEGLKPLHPISTWADLMAKDLVADLRQDRAYVQEHYHRTGCMTHAMYPLYKYRYLSQTAPELIKEARFVSSQIEYLFLQLTGERAVSHANASGSSLYNLHISSWDQDLLAEVGLTVDKLSELKSNFYLGALTPEVAQFVGLPSGTPVTVGMPDGALNQVAVGGANKGVMSFSVGTSGALRLAVDEPTLPKEPSTWCYHLMDGTYLAGAATNGTNNLDWFMENAAASGQDYAYYNQAVASVDPADAPFFVPFIYGERCPGWGENRLGGFLGLKPQHNRAQMYYAVLEGILFNLYQCYEILSTTAGEPEQIMVSGGIMNSPTWLQMASDIFDRELFTTGTKNDSTFGAALVAAAALAGGSAALQTLTSDISSVSVSRPRGREISRVYKERYRRYLELYGKLS